MIAGIEISTKIIYNYLSTQVILCNVNSIYQETLPHNEQP